MNRRNFLQTTTALGIASLVPSWLTPSRSAINLAAFCRTDKSVFDCAKPFVQDTAEGAARFATDCRICVRVPGNSLDKIGQPVALPPASGLFWEQPEQLKGKWLPWPKRNHLAAHKTNCPKCHGVGKCNGDLAVCSLCDMRGQWMNAKGAWEQCDWCEGEGTVTSKTCSHCGGNGNGRFAGIQPIGDGFLDSDFDTKIRHNLRDLEFYLPDSGLTGNGFVKRKDHGKVAMLFRFEGGHGLVVPLVKQVAIARLKA